MSTQLSNSLKYCTSWESIQVGYPLSFLLCTLEVHNKPVNSLEVDGEAVDSLEKEPSEFNSPIKKVELTLPSNLSW